jgi:starvation-inducible DNA-binding protein
MKSSSRRLARWRAWRQSADAVTSDLLVGDVIRTNELQVWFVAEHVVDTPIIRAE